MNPHVQRIIDRLKAGETFTNSEGGNSMVPLIYSRQPVTLAPVDPDKLEVGDIVYVKVRGRVYTHKIVGLKLDEVQIGNNRGGVNGWTRRENVYGIVVAVEGRVISGAAAKVRRPAGA